MYDATDGLQFLITDHLGSVVAVTDDTGALVSSSQQRYLPFGGELLEADSSTDFGYTGQRSNTGDFGLMDYNARWYSPKLGRFTQPDTIVPAPNNPQSLNRYSYVLNNPIRNVDPSGLYPISTTASTNSGINSIQVTYRVNHVTGNPLAGSMSGLFGPCPSPRNQTLDEAEIKRLTQEIETYGIELRTEGDVKWGVNDLSVVLDAIETVANRMNSSISWIHIGKFANPGRIGLFKLFFDHLRITRLPSQVCPATGGCPWLGWTNDKTTTEPHRIRLRAPLSWFDEDRWKGIELLLHEMGHVFSNELEDAPDTWVQTIRPGAPPIPPPAPGEGERESNRDRVFRIAAKDAWDLFWTAVWEGLGAVKRSGFSPPELFADAFVSWVRSDWDYTHHSDDAAMWASETHVYMVQQIINKVVDN